MVDKWDYKKVWPHYTKWDFILINNQLIMNWYSPYFLMGLQNWWKNVSWDVAQRRRVHFVAPAARAENQKRRDTLITADLCSILSLTSRLSVTSTGPAVAQKHMAWPKWPSWTPSNWPLFASALSPCTRWGELLSAHTRTPTQLRRASSSSSLVTRRRSVFIGNEWKIRKYRRNA